MPEATHQERSSKPLSNKALAVQARKYLVSLNQGFHEVDSNAKSEIQSYLAELRLAVPPGAYDLIKLPHQQPSPKKTFTKQELEQIVLVEVKSSNRDIPSDLKGYFFSLQYAEQLAAQALGDRYIFMFVICHGTESNWFHQQLRWQDIWARSKAIHMQWSIRF